MPRFPQLRTLAGFALLAALSCCSANAQDDDDRAIKHVFVIALENHNWTQPISIPGKIQQVYQNPGAPFINSLVNGTATTYINGHLVNISKQVSYATAYHNVLATESGAIHISIHPNPNTCGRKQAPTSAFSMTMILIQTILRMPRTRLST